MDNVEGEESDELLRKLLGQNRELLTAFNRAWPLLEATDLVGDLWSVPAYLRKCAPWLGADDVRRLQRPDAQAWTVADLPFVDVARQRLGDPETSRRRRRQEAVTAVERERMSTVIDELIATDDSELLLMTTLRHQDLRDALVDQDALPTADPDLLAGPFAHIVVDEAQELTDAEWQMLLLRCPSTSGDRAQARRVAESWGRSGGRAMSCCRTATSILRARSASRRARLEAASGRDRGGRRLRDRVSSGEGHSGS